MIAILSWLAPPIFGALIGYVTNRIAIKMLFRPRTTWHILGIHIPFTPGIIPKSRDEIASNIGQMVARQLLSPEAIREQMDSPALQENLKLWVRHQREALMERPIRLPDATNVQEEASTQLLEDLLAELLPQLARSSVFQQVVSSLATSLISTIGQRQLDEIITPEEVSRLASDRLLPLLEKPELHGAVSEQVNHWIDEQLAANRPFSSYLDSGLQEALLEAVKDKSPLIVQAIVQYLRQRATRDELARIGIAMLQETISQQGPITRVLIKLSGKEDEVVEKMPQVVDSILGEVEAVANSKRMQRQIADTTQTLVRQLAESGVGDLLGKYRPEIHGAVRRLTGNALGAIARTPRDQVHAVTALLYSEYSNYTIAEAAERTFGFNQIQAGELVSNIIVEYAQANAKPETLMALLGNLSEAGETKTLSDLVSLSKTTTQRVDECLSQHLVRFLNAQIPTLSKILDIEKMVTNRIKTFDTADVEELIMGVTGRHLKYINYFGALLGALIGILHVMLQVVI